MDYDQGIVRRRRVIPASNVFFSNAAAAGYTGPGDIVSGATAWYGLRAYSAAKAGTACIDIVKTSDGSALMTINTLADGTLDVATISALGYAVSVTKIYDQTGGGIHLTQATLANMPGLTLGPVGSGLKASRPAMNFPTAGASHALSNATGFGAVAQAFSISGVFDIISRAVFDGVFTDSAGSGFLTNNAANGILLYEGDSITPVSATDNAFHRVQWVANTTTSHCYLDGTDNAISIGAASTGWATGAAFIGNDAIRNSPNMNLCEVGIWPTGFSAGNASSINSNQQAYWF